MKNTTTQRLDERDIECVNVLKNMGYSSPAARVIVALTSGGKTQMELTSCTEENQSAISVALKQLVAGKLVNVSAGVQTGEKGRPKQTYNLTSLDAVISLIEKEAIRNYEKQTTRINRLKELID